MTRYNVAMALIVGISTAAVSVFLEAHGRQFPTIFWMVVNILIVTGLLDLPVRPPNCAPNKTLRAQTVTLRYGETSDELIKTAIQDMRDNLRTNWVTRDPTVTNYSFLAPSFLVWRQKLLTGQEVERISITVCLEVTHKC